MDTPLEKPLDLRGIADFLKVGWWRVRRWRWAALQGLQRRRLPRPDVSNLPNNPLWSRQIIQQWAQAESLWPPGSDQFECPVCHSSYSVYESGLLRPHARPIDEPGEWECEGSGRRPAGAAVRT